MTTEIVNRRRRSRERSWRDHAKTIWLRFVWAHPTPVQLLVAVASFIWATTCLVNPDIMRSGPYQMVLNGWFSDPRIWGWLFAAHSMLSFWRVFDPAKRVWVGLAVNIFGFILWGYVTGRATLFAGVRPSLAWDFVGVLCAFACIVKTGAAKESA